MSRAIDDIKDEEIDNELSGLSGGANNPSDILDKKVTLFQQLHENIREELEGNYWEITNYNPLQFIIAHSGHNQVIHATVGRKKEAIQDKQDFDTDGYKSVPSLKLQYIIIGAIPTEITYHENPLGFIEDTYTIKFSSHTGKTFTIGPKTLEEIISVLRQKALVFVSREATEALSIIVNAFAKNNKIIINNDIETPGVYWIDNQLKAYHVNHPKPSKKEIQACCDLLDILVTKYRRKEVIPTAIKWAIIAPFNFALKQYTNDGAWLPWLYPYGWPRTGKTTIGGTIINGIWGKSSDRKHKIPFSSIDSEAKLGFILSQSTYPITINEVGALGDDRHKKMLEMIKNSIETKIARSRHINKTTYTDVAALCPCILTSNPQPPRDPGYQSRIIPIVFTKEDRHTTENKKEFDNLLSGKEHLLRIVGDFTINYIMNHHQVLLRKKKEECNWKETAKEVIIKFYEAADKPSPYWIDYFIEERQIEDSIDDSRLLVRSFFINLINNTYNRFVKNIDDIPNMKRTFHMRFNFCCENKLIPFISLINNDKTITIFSDVMRELHNPNSGIDINEVASLQELANTIGLQYGQKWLNGKNTRVAYGEMTTFISFLDSEIKESSEELGPKLTSLEQSKSGKSNIN